MCLLRNRNNNLTEFFSVMIEDILKYRANKYKYTQINFKIQINVLS